MGATWIVCASSLKGERALQVANHTCPGETRSPEVRELLRQRLTQLRAGGRLGQEESAGWRTAPLTCGQPHVSGFLLWLRVESVCSLALAVTDEVPSGRG